MNRDPRKPRYRAPEKPYSRPRAKGKDRPLDLTPAHPSKGWRKEIWKIMALVIVPTILIWGCDLQAHPYVVKFIPRATDVRFDGKAVTLDSVNNFSFPRLTFGTHRLEYRSAAGEEKKLMLHPRIDDGRMSPLYVREDSIEGVPAAEFVR